MTPIKIGGKIFGAKLTNAEQTAMNMEIQKALAEYDRKNILELNAITLWILMSEFGFSIKKLRKFHDTFIPTLDALCARYEMTDAGDNVWLSTHMLKEHGVDVEQWHKELTDAGDR